MDLKNFIQTLQFRCETLMYEYDQWGQLWYESGDAESDFEIAFVDVVYRYSPRGKNLSEMEYEKIAELGKQMALTLEFHASAIDYDHLVLKMDDIVKLLMSDSDLIFMLGY